MRAEMEDASTIVDIRSPALDVNDGSCREAPLN